MSLKKSARPFSINEADVTFQELNQPPIRDSDSRRSYHELKQQGNQHHQNIHSSALTKDVPIYKMSSHADKLLISCKHPAPSLFFAHGELVGKFYESNQLKLLSGVSFVGQFEGMFDWPAPENHGSVYFEGKIEDIQLLTKEDEHIEDETIKLVSDYESTFHGYFRGLFFPWAQVGGIDNIDANRLVYRKVPYSMCYLLEDNCNREALECVEAIEVKTEYLLPVLVRFQILNFGDIDLDKSKAVVNANLILEVKYNDTVDELIRVELERNKSVTLNLNFNRDFTLNLPLSEEDDSSEDSEWSIQDKTWDIEFTRHTQSKTYRYKIMKRFRAEIDNSYGAFFAPFNLSRLKIVVGLAPLYLQDQTIRVSFTVADTLEYAENGPYDPFVGFDELSTEQGRVSERQVNRYHKINRHFCSDSGEYIIADNLLTLYPHYRVILLNKSYINEDHLWKLGLRNFSHFFEAPLARNLVSSFHKLKQIKLKEAGELVQEEREGKQKDGVDMGLNKFFTFSFLRWNHAIIEIPIYKYIVIDMIKIFVPLTIITVISLLIFQQENGVGTSSGFTTLAYRLVNIAAIAIVYVSMIPIIRSSLPAMPSITLIEIITYLETIPSLLAILNSLLNYIVAEEEWRQKYLAFHDFLFLIGFVLSLINLVAFLTVLVIYYRLPYRCKWKIDQYDPALIRWRSPYYLQFMQSIQTHRNAYYTLTEDQQ